MFFFSGKVPEIGEPVVSAYESADRKETSKPVHQTNFGGKYSSPPLVAEQPPQKQRRPSYRPPSSSDEKRPYRLPQPPKTAEKPPSFHPQKVTSKRPSSYRRPPQSLRPKPVGEAISSKPLSAFVSISALEEMRHKRPPKTLSSSRPSTTPEKVVRPPRNKQLTSSAVKRPTSTLSFGDKKTPVPSRRKPLGTSKPSRVPEEISSDEVPHVPREDEPVEGVAPPATQDESFSIAKKPHRYAIRREGMASVRSRLNGIVHDK